MGPFYKKFSCDKLVIDQPQPGVFYLEKLMNFMKMRTFYKKLPLFIKNSILHT